jgi:hypothetical protein
MQSDPVNVHTVLSLDPPDVGVRQQVRSRGVRTWTSAT